MGFDQVELVNSFDYFIGINVSGSIVQSLGWVVELVCLLCNVLCIVSLLLFVLLIGFGYFWWQEYFVCMLEIVGLSFEYVEVESVDGIIEIYILDEFEDQVVIEVQKEGE